MDIQYSSLKKGFLKSCGAVSFGFLMAAAGQQAHADTAPPPPPSGTTTMSLLLKKIEAEANATNPAHRIIIVDTDALNTLAHESITFPDRRLGAYLESRDLNISWGDRSTLDWAMGAQFGPESRNPQALHFNAKDKNAKDVPVCVVSPEIADLSSRSLLEQWIGSAGPKQLRATIDPGPYAMTARVAWHEAWHCLDTDFVQSYKTMDRDQGFEFALAIHRAEMFADVAATLTMARDGNLAIMQHTADARAVHSRWNGPKMMVDYSPKYDAEYYSGLTYYVTPAHDAALAHIQTVGEDVVRNYSMDDIKRIAKGLTLKNALNAQEFRVLANYLKNEKSYVKTLSAKAAQGDVTSQQNLAAINRYQKRADIAKANLMIETNTPVIQKPDIVPPTVLEILGQTSKEEKADIELDISKAISTALRSGLTARQGVYNQLERWRHELHTDTARRPDLERKLYLAGVMLYNGKMDHLLLQSHQVPKPSF